MTTEHLRTMAWYSGMTIMHTCWKKNLERKLCLPLQIQQPQDSQHSQGPQVRGVDDTQHSDASQGSQGAVGGPIQAIAIDLLPTDEHCAEWLQGHGDLARIAAPLRPSQKDLPRSCINLIGETLHMLWSMACSAELGAHQKQIAEALLLTAPGWLWREPTEPTPIGRGALPPIPPIDGCRRHLKAKSALHGRCSCPEALPLQVPGLRRRSLQSGKFNPKALCHYGERPRQQRLKSIYRAPHCTRQLSSEEAGHVTH